MSALELKKRHVQIEHKNIDGIVEDLECYIIANYIELDGSRTIVLRTEPDEDVKNFLNKRINDEE